MGQKNSSSRNLFEELSPAADPPPRSGRRNSSSPPVAPPRPVQHKTSSSYRLPPSYISSSASFSTLYEEDPKIIEQENQEWRRRLLEGEFEDDLHALTMEITEIHKTLRRDNVLRLDPNGGAPRRGNSKLGRTRDLRLYKLYLMAIREDQQRMEESQDTTTFSEPSSASLNSSSSSSTEADQLSLIESTESLTPHDSTHETNAPSAEPTPLQKLLQSSRNKKQIAGAYAPSSTSAKDAKLRAYSSYPAMLSYSSGGAPPPAASAPPSDSSSLSAATPTESHDTAPPRNENKHTRNTHVAVRGTDTALSDSTPKRRAAALMSYSTPSAVSSQPAADVSDGDSDVDEVDSNATASDNDDNTAATSQSAASANSTERLVAEISAMLAQQPQERLAELLAALSAGGNAMSTLSTPQSSDATAAMPPRSGHNKGKKRGTTIGRQSRSRRKPPKLSAAANGAWSTSNMLSQIFPGSTPSATKDSTAAGGEAANGSVRRRNQDAANTVGVDVDNGRPHHDWNLRFQTIISQLNENTPMGERMRLYEELAHLAEDFIHIAKTYGKIIISEAFLPDEQKTIKPIRGTATGFSGGAKYVVHRIYFKFAIDTHGFYGGDVGAMKVAGHDLKGLIHYFNAGVPGLSFPLMALVDYRGFRLIAMSLLPIDPPHTLIYGSADACATRVRNDTEVCKLMMRTTAEVLNLKPHRVVRYERAWGGVDSGDSSSAAPSTDSTLLYSAADLEGHRGSDGRYYLLDFARAFPAAALPLDCDPDPPGNNAHLYRLLRPELVAANPVPLCPDAYSGFVPPEDYAAHAAEVENATRRLLDDVIPAFAEELNRSGDDGVRWFRVKRSLHARGINIRYAGRLRGRVAKDREDVRALLLVEMIARVVRDDLNARMRAMMAELHLPLEEPYRRMVVGQLNLVFGQSEAADRYWSDVIKPGIVRKFGSAALSPDEEAVRPGSALRPVWRPIGMLPGLPGPGNGLRRADMCALFRRLQELTGIRFTQRVAAEMSSNPSMFYPSGPAGGNREGSGSNSASMNDETFEFLPFEELSLEDLGERVKHMNIVTIAQGYVFKTRGRLEAKGSAKQRWLWRLACERFEEALMSHPCDKVTLRNYADVLHSLGLHARANELYRRALQIDPYDITTLFKYAVFFEECDLHDQAEHFYLRALETNPNHDHCLQRYGDFLSNTRGEHDIAEKFYMRASYQRALKMKVAQKQHEQAGGQGPPPPLRGATLWI